MRRVIDEITVMSTNNRINSQYNFLLTGVFDAFGTSMKSNFLESQMTSTPKINPMLIKFMKYDTNRYSSTAVV